MSGPAFIPWHRVLVNRMGELIRQIHPGLSLHYWDWTTDAGPLGLADLAVRDVPLQRCLGRLTGGVGTVNKHHEAR
jgi:hypothetical protein